MLIIISGAAGALLSALFEYIPGFHQWYNGLAEETKKLIMLGAVTLVSASVFGLSCTNSPLVAGVGATCDRDGVWALVAAWVAAVTANQSVHRILPAGPTGV